jgi:hypothetical protein
MEDALQNLEITAPRVAKGTSTPGGPPPPPPPPPPPSSKPR